MGSTILNCAPLVTELSSFENLNLYIVLLYHLFLFFPSFKKLWSIYVTSHVIHGNATHCLPCTRINPQTLSGPRWASRALSITHTSWPDTSYSFMRRGTDITKEKRWQLECTPAICNGLSELRRKQTLGVMWFCSIFNLHVLSLNIFNSLTYKSIHK